MKFILGFLFSLAVTYSCLGQEGDNEPLKARVWMKSGAVMDVHILPSRSDKALRVQLPNIAGRVEYRYDDIQAVAFHVAPQMEQVREFDKEGNTKEAAAIASETLMPLLHYISLETNIRDDVLYLLSLLLRSEQYNDLLEALNRLQPAWTDSEDLNLLRLYTILGEGFQSQDYKSLNQLHDLPYPKEGTPLFAPYWLGRLKHHMHFNQWRWALRDAAYITTLQGRDHHWVPHALYWNARLYWKLRDEKATDSVIAEMKLSYPDHPLTADAISVKEDFPHPNLKAGSFEEHVGNAWKRTPEGPVILAVANAGNLHDNGILPDGEQALAVTVTPSSPPVTVYQTIEGFQPGESYFLTGFQSARAAEGADAAGPFLEIRINNEVIEKRHLVKPVQGKGRYTRPFRRMVSQAFTATAPKLTLAIIVTPGIGNEKETRTLLIDDLRILERSVHTDEFTPEQP